MKIEAFGITYFIDQDLEFFFLDQENSVKNGTLALDQFKESWAKYEANKSKQNMRMKIQPQIDGQKHGAALEIDRDLFQSLLGFAPPKDCTYTVPEFCVEAVNGGVFISLIQDVINSYQEISYVYDQYKLNRCDADPKKIILEALEFFMTLAEVIEEGNRREKEGQKRIELRVSYFE